MRKRAAFYLAVTGLVALGSPAGAAICTLDDVPAATLVLTTLTMPIPPCTRFRQSLTQGLSEEL